MRYLILSDMHGNWDAFEAVLEHAGHSEYDVTLVLGDLVGYGGSPNEIVDAVRDRLPGKVHRIRGNHDKVVAQIESGDNFNHAALMAAHWTTNRLKAENLRYVKELPEGPMEVAEGTAICHGSPLDEDAYVFSDFDAFEIFSVYHTPLTFFGHTHVPSFFAQRDSGIEVRALRDSGKLRLDDDIQYLVNPGSVGQPRDRDPRAAYMSYDDSTRTVRWYRIDYPVEKAQQRILRAGLPAVLAERLALGV